MGKKHSKTMNILGYIANEHCSDVLATVFELQLHYLFASFSR